MYKEGSVSQ